jgi:hypothetical protein
MGLTLAQWVLRALAVLSLLGALAVVLGGNGTGSLFDRHVPWVVTEQVQRFWPQSSKVPAAPVLVRPAHWEDTYEEFNQGYPDGGASPRGWAELSTGHPDTVGRVGDLTFWDPGFGPRTAWVLALVLAPLGLAWLWWMLSRIAGSARRGDPFIAANAKRLAWAGALVLVGPPLALLSQQAVLRWMLAESTASQKADIWFRWEWIPVWPLGAGLALLVLAAVWRRGVAMRSDLEGLV